jgi:hypothetical protein
MEEIKTNLKTIRELIKGSQNYLICKGNDDNESFNNFINEFEIADKNLGMFSFDNCKNAYKIMRIEFSDYEIIEMYKALEV